MEKQKRNAIILGVCGLILMMIGLKFLPLLVSTAGQQDDFAGKPVILFFNEDEPCECMVELTEIAEKQIAEWPVILRADIPIERFGFRKRQDLEAKYKVFRAPCLVLVDAQDQIVWRQDYPLIEGGPFKLEDLEVAIAELVKE